MKIRTLVLATTSLATLPLSGCMNSAMNKDVDTSYQKNQEAIQQHLAHPTANQKFVINKGRFVDTKMHDLDPDWFQQPVEMHAVGVPLVQVMHVIAGNSDIKFIYTDDIKNQKININYQGDLHGALLHIMHKNNLYFSIEGGDQKTVRWSATESKTFDIAFMPGDTSFTVGSSKGQGGNDSSSASLSGNVSVWQDIEKTIKGMLSPQGQFDISESTSTVTVTDKPLVVEKVAQFIKNYNKALSLRVTLHMKILEVQLNKQHQYGIDWNLVYKGMSLGGMTGNAVKTLTGFAANAASDGGDDTSVTTSKNRMKWSGTSFFINALDGQGKTSIIDEPTVTTLNNAPSTLSITDKKAYIKSTEVTSTGSGDDATTQYSINPDNIETGLKMTLIPHIQGNKVYLSIDGSLSSLQGIETKSFGKSGSNQYEVQLPETTSKDFNQRVMAEDQHLIVLSGLRTQDKSNQDNRNFNTTLLGNNNDQINQKELVVLIEPEIVRV